MTTRTSKKRFHRAFADVVLPKVEADSLRKFADELEIQGSTLHQNISTLSRNRDFSSEFSQKVCRALGLTESQFADAIRKALDKQPIDPISFVEESAAKLFTAGTDDAYHDQVQTVLNSLPAGAEYMFVTHAPPWEFLDTSMADLVERKLEEEVNISYFFPRPDEGQFEKSYQAFLGTSDFSWMALERGFNSFKSKLSTEYALTSDDLNRINFWFCDNPFLMNPLVKIAAFSHTTETDEQELALIETTVRISERSEQKNWWPLPALQTSMVIRAIRDVMENSEPQ